MTKNEYDLKIEKLISWAHEYYVNDNPLASDEEYDNRLYDALTKRCTDSNDTNCKLAYK